MPPVVRKESIRSERISLGLKKKSVRRTRSSGQSTAEGVVKNDSNKMNQKKPSVDQKNSSVEPITRPILRRTSAGDRRPSSDGRKSSISMGRISIKDRRSSKAEKSTTDRKEFRVSTAAIDIMKALNFINNPQGHSYYSFSDTDSIKYDEGARKLGPALVSAASEFAKPLHRLSQMIAPVTKRKGNDISPDGSFDGTEHSREFPSGSSFLRNVQDEDFEEKEDETSEDFGPLSVGESTAFLFDSRIEGVFDIDFFESIAQIPSIDKVSLDTSIQKFYTAPKAHIVKFDGADAGKFVDPLTGTSLSSSSSEMLEQLKSLAGSRKLSRISIKSKRSTNIQENDDDEEEEGEEEESPFIPREPKEDDELLTLVGLDSDEEESYRIENEKPPEDTAMDIYWHQQKRVLIEEALKTAEKKVVNEVEAALRESIAKFFDHIIAKVVAKVELKRPAMLLRKTLDKKALMEELKDKLHDLEIEQKARLFLSRKIVEYYRRKNSFRNIVEDSPETITDNMEKYTEVLANLDVAISKEEEIKESAATEIDRGTKELQEIEEIERESYNNFETLIRETTTKENYNSLKNVVNVELEKMAAVREEISQLRVTLIETQHLMARLKRQNEKMENIGDGLTVAQYENMQAEITLLDKKLEERNIELNKLRTSCTSGVHMITHLKEKEKMIRNVIAVRQSCLDDLLEEKAQCRSYINRAQIQRKKLRKEIEHVIFQGGLHGKPELMADYDATVKRKNHLKKKVSGMKHKLSMMQSRIELFQSTITLKSANEDKSSEDSSLHVNQSFQSK